MTAAARVPSLVQLITKQGDVMRELLILEHGTIQQVGHALYMLPQVAAATATGSSQAFACRASRAVTSGLVWRASLFSHDPLIPPSHRSSSRSSHDPHIPHANARLKNARFQPVARPTRAPLRLPLQVIEPPEDENSDDTPDSLGDEDDLSIAGPGGEDGGGSFNDGGASFVSVTSLAASSDLDLSKHSGSEVDATPTVDVPEELVANGTISLEEGYEELEAARVAEKAKVKEQETIRQTLQLTGTCMCELAFLFGMRQEASLLALSGTTCLVLQARGLARRRPSPDSHRG